ncbi:hypothetical protein Tco_1118803 [Tanacetum coccineum]
MGVANNFTLGVIFNYTRMVYFSSTHKVYKAIVSYTSLVDKALIDDVGETRDMDMLVVDNVVNRADNGKGVSIDDEVLTKHMKLDKGKSTMTQKDHFISKKRKIVSKENQVNSSGNETDMGSETESDEPERPPTRNYDIGDGDTIKQHALCMEELMWKLKRNGSGLTDPFTIVQKSCERFSIYDEETHWKLKKPKLGDKFVNAEQFRECLTFYALANGFSLWFYRSCKNKMIAKCGQREEKIKDPSKGKQRPYKKFPSNNADKSICPWRCYGKMLKTENSFQVRIMQISQENGQKPDKHEHENGKSTKEPEDCYQWST